MKALAEKIQERIGCYCVGHVGIGVSTLDRTAVDLPLPATLTASGWLEPVATDGHPSGFVFVYDPELIAGTVQALNLRGIDRYLDTVLDYVTLFVHLADELPDVDVRRREVERRIYDHDAGALALLSEVQFGLWRGDRLRGEAR
jgi:hypothetical protein